MYLTYEEYQNMGGTLEETAFNDYEFQARAKIDWYTFNRLENETDIPEKVKRCMLHIIRLLQEVASVSGTEDTADSTSSGAAVASYSNDGVSVSYNVLSASEIVNSIDTKLERIIKQELQGVMNSLGHKLLYRGVYADE